MVVLVAVEVEVVVVVVLDLDLDLDLDLERPNLSLEGWRCPRLKNHVEPCFWRQRKKTRTRLEQTQRKEERPLRKELQAQVRRVSFF